MLDCGRLNLSIADVLYGSRYDVRGVVKSSANDPLGQCSGGW